MAVFLRASHITTMTLVGPQLLHVKPPSNFKFYGTNKTKAEATHQTINLRNKVEYKRKEQKAFNMATQEQKL